MSSRLRFLGHVFYVVGLAVILTIHIWQYQWTLIFATYGLGSFFCFLFGPLRIGPRKKENDYKLARPAWSAVIFWPFMLVPQLLFMLSFVILLWMKRAYDKGTLPIPASPDGVINLKRGKDFQDKR